MAKRPVTIRAIRRYSNRFASDIFFSPRYRELQCPNPKAKFCSALAYVRFGSKADICGALSHVRPPESGHVQCSGQCLLWAKSGHRTTTGVQERDAATRGKVTRISVNSPGRVSTSIEPPCCLTMMS